MYRALHIPTGEYIKFIIMSETPMDWALPNPYALDDPFLKSLYGELKLLEYESKEELSTFVLNTLIPAWNVASLGLSYNVLVPCIEEFELEEIV